MAIGVYSNQAGLAHIDSDQGVRPLSPPLNNGSRVFCAFVAPLDAVARSFCQLFTVGLIALWFSIGAANRENINTGFGVFERHHAVCFANHGMRMPAH